MTQPTASVIERLRENIVADAFKRRDIVPSLLAERLIRERHEAADLLEEAAIKLIGMAKKLHPYALHEVPKIIELADRIQGTRT